MAEQKIAYRGNPALSKIWFDTLLSCGIDPLIIDQYHLSTGKNFPLISGISPEEFGALLEKISQQEILDFIEWFNVNVWGDDPFKDESGTKT